MSVEEPTNLGEFAGISRNPDYRSGAAAMRICLADLYDKHQSRWWFRRTRGTIAKMDLARIPNPW